jgi:hypothetical protein
MRPEPDNHPPVSLHSFDHLTELYKVYRDYMKHEDDLLNQRTTWLLVIQGFLFATLAVLGEWVSPKDPLSDLLRTERLYLIYVLVFVGILIAVAAFISILAANKAIDSLQKKWEKELKQYYRAEDWDLFPGIAGGGHKKAKAWGKTPALAIPCIVALAWIIVAGMNANDKLYPPTAQAVGAQPGAQTTQAPMPQSESRPDVGH